MSYLIKCSSQYPYRYMCTDEQGKTSSWHQNACEATLFENYDKALELANKSKLSDISILEITTKYIRPNNPKMERRGEPLTKQEQALYSKIKEMPTSYIRTRDDLFRFILRQARKAGLNLYDGYSYSGEGRRWDDSNYKEISIKGEKTELHFDRNYFGSTCIKFKIHLPHSPIPPRTNYRSNKINEKLYEIISSCKYPSYYDYDEDIRLEAKYKIEEAYNFFIKLLGIDMSKLALTGIKRGDKEPIKYLNDVIENNARNINRLQTSFDIWYDMNVEKVKPELERAVEYIMNGAKD